MRGQRRFKQYAHVGRLLLHRPVALCQLQCGRRAMHQLQFKTRLFALVHRVAAQHGRREAGIEQRDLVNGSAVAGRLQGEGVAQQQRVDPRLAFEQRNHFGRTLLFQ